MLNVKQMLICFEVYNYIVYTTIIETSESGRWDWFTCYLCTVGLPGDVDMFRDRRGSVSTQQTERTERFELEESSEFLNPVDRSNFADDLDYQVMTPAKLSCKLLKSRN